MAKGFIIGFILAFVVLAVGAYFYFGLGLAPVATSADPMPFETYLAQRGLKAAVHKASDLKSPLDASEPNLLAGATVYRQNCAVCHGLPGREMTSIAQGEFPKPPQLLKGKGVTDDPVGETFWLVQNGVRLTGMPGFKASLNETQMWQVSQLLANADKLPESVKSELLRKD